MKAQNARGTRDFSPEEVKKRNFIIQTIQKHFERYGFLPIETPAIENLSTLTGKYGEEGDQLLFKILNSRLHESKNKDVLKQEFEKMLEKPYNSELITERALRYDLTVPFARYVSQYRHTITFPFKRYQIQPVWRADRPQKGRYREFVQCDADVVGTNSLLMEVELVSLINDVFEELFPKETIVLKFNNRKILQGIVEWLKVSDHFYSFVGIIDRLDKIDYSEFEKFLKNELKNINLWNLLMNDLLEKSNSGHIKTGVEEMKYVLDRMDKEDLSIILQPDISLARGLNYYTGMIFEAKVLQSKFDAEVISSSILGGGRYDNLTGIFDFPGVSGVGISFGIDRIYDVMEALHLFDDKKLNIYPAEILLVYLSNEDEKYCLSMAKRLRKQGIRVDIYHQVDKLKKVMEYADKKKYPYVGIVGEEERINGLVSLFNN
jgi:histidyl-tRNA synthetase